MERLTSLGTITELCQRHGFSLSKGFGQNFLVNPGICPKICQAAEIDKNTDVLEIGPGFGTLTRELAAAARRVVALEVDRRLLPVLEETLAGCSNVKVLEADALTAPIGDILAKEFGGPAVLCANLPYYITSPLIMRMLEEKLPLTRLTVLVQKEAAARMAAEPGTRECGAISYGVRYHATPHRHFNVQPGSFYPAPRVVSTLLSFLPHPVRMLENEPQREQRLFSLVRGAFGQRRKTAANAISAGVGLEKASVSAALWKIGLKEDIRPEQLTLEQFIALEAALWPEG